MLYYTVLPAQPFPCIYRPNLGTGLTIVLVQTFSIAADYNLSPLSSRVGWSSGGPQLGGGGGEGSRHGSGSRSASERVAPEQLRERRCSNPAAALPTPPHPGMRAGQSPPFPRGAAAPPVVPRPVDNSRGAAQHPGAPSPTGGGPH